MKVTAFVGSARKKSTYHAAQHFLESLQSIGGNQSIGGSQTIGEIDYEIVRLSDYHLEVCRGCKLCTDKGEEFCPLKDDRDILIDKMKNSDGVLFATPNYSFQVSAFMKIFLDRLGFFFHRPQFFGKTYTNIVSQGVYGGKNITKYLNFVGNGLGFNRVKGCFFTALEPIPESKQQKIDRLMEKHSKTFYLQLTKEKHPKPGLFELFMFRFTRTRIHLMLDDTYRDYTYFKETGWFGSDFYYPTKLGPFKALAGNFFDWMAGKMTKENEIN